MNRSKLKIGWQKYEDLIEKQLSSPMLNNIMRTIAQNRATEDVIEEDEQENYEELEKFSNLPIMFPISEQLLEDLSMLSNFDCWIGHTNFDITPKIKDILNTIPGIEILKICSRYRFFIGIGNMFDFTDVRKIIEKELVKEK